MKTLQFRCRLLSDVILSQRAATEGSHETLDFIPGGVFLGIAAAEYDNYTPQEQALLFHSGKVRFGDAHPVSAHDTVRTLHVPAAFFYPKLSGMSSTCYLSHFHDNTKEDPGRPLQLKQCRQGFCSFGNNGMKTIPMDKGFAIKSAYDRELRRSEDSKMYGYESLGRGTEFLFSIEMDDDRLAQKISLSLIGTKHIGRSRTAQYGLAEITQCQYTETKSTKDTFKLDGHTCITVYADGRLIFLDASGEPTFMPTAADLGLSPEDEILWEKSQLRTFQYAPWNGKRQTRDSDRMGFEKGSTFVVRLKSRALPDMLPPYIGSYKNEGFGKVIFGWSMLQKAGANGLLEIKIVNDVTTKKQDIATKDLSTPLIAYLRNKRKQMQALAYIYREVNDFHVQYSQLFPTAIFASQWGEIRRIATIHGTYEKISCELFDKKQTVKRDTTPTDSRTEVSKPAAYLTHGVAAAKWTERNRLKVLREFVEKMGHNPEYGDLSQKALINLSSEMAKK